jgi:putative transposase
MKCNPNKHHRCSIRLKGYDYSQAGLYFITICCQDRAPLFGQIIDNKMVMNDAGNMIIKWYYELENKYPDKKCHEMVVMPNHFHCIIQNAPVMDANVNMDTDVKPDTDVQKGAHVGAPLRGRPNTRRDRPDTSTVGQPNTQNNSPNHPQQYGPNNKKYNATIGDAMNWFKTMTTNEYIRGVKTNNWEPFNGKLWQRNYWEHVIRNEKSLRTIRVYIINNPKNWDNDKLILP